MNVPLAAVTGNYALGDSGNGRLSRKVIELVVGSLVGSFVVNGRLSGGGGTFVPIPYMKHYLNGAVGDESYVSTALTGNSLIEVRASGMEIQLAYTHTSGSTAGAALRFLDLIE